MISLIRAMVSGNTYLVTHTDSAQFTVLERIKIFHPVFSRDMVKGHTSFYCGFDIIKTYETIKEAIEDNFVDLI